MAASDEKYMKPVVYPSAPSYRKDANLRSTGGTLTKKEKRLAEHYRYKAAEEEMARRLAVQGADVMNDVTYTVMDSNERMTHEANDIARRPMGEIARHNVVNFNAMALGTHEKNLRILQDLTERHVVEVATTDMEPEPEPEPKGLIARIVGR